MDNQKSTIQRTGNKVEKQNKNITIHKQTQIMYLIRHEPSYKQHGGIQTSERNRTTHTKSESTLNSFIEIYLKLY
jgi:hypothetical protein